MLAHGRLQPTLPVRAKHRDQVPAMLNERRLGQRPVNHGQVPTRRRGHQTGHHGQVLATHNERRREQLPGHHDQVTRKPKRGRGQK